MTHVSTSMFQGLFKNKVFKSVALVTKVRAILDFLRRTRLLPPYGLYPTMLWKKKILQKKILFEAMSFLEYPRPCCLKNIIQFLSSLTSYSLQININAYFYSIDVTKIFVLLNFYCNIYLHKINHNIFLTHKLYSTYTNYIVFITKNDVFYISY